jgi:hypothetical protein
MMIKRCLLLSLVFVAACRTLPTGPSVLVLPGAGKSFDQFQVDNDTCRQWASYQTGGASPQRTHEAKVAEGAVVGAAVGAAAGAAIGAAAGAPGQGAAIGAGSGLLVGTASGADAGALSSRELQTRYDHAYLQCMYASGHQVPMVAAPQPPSAPYYYPSPPSSSGSPPPPGNSANIPPPPPGLPPPPPPR